MRQPARPASVDRHGHRDEVDIPRPIAQAVASSSSVLRPVCVCVYEREREGRDFIRKQGHRDGPTEVLARPSNRRCIALCGGLGLGRGGLAQGSHASRCWTPISTSDISNGLSEAV
jgi:hypothetical protein